MAQGQAPGLPRTDCCWAGKLQVAPAHAGKVVANALDGDAEGRVKVIDHGAAPWQNARTLPRGPNMLAFIATAAQTTSTPAVAGSITISDGLIILATILGPVLAVQAQKWVERARKTADVRTWIFTTLMNTRSTRMSAAHIDALNGITIAFHDGGRRFRSKKSQAVLNKWREYLTYLGQATPTSDAEYAAHAARGTEIFTNLLETMAIERGFEVDRAEIVAGAYYPKGFALGEQQRNEAVDRVMRILRGEKGLRVVLDSEESSSSVTNGTSGHDS